MRTFKRANTLSNDNICASEGESILSKNVFTIFIDFRGRSKRVHVVRRSPRMGSCSPYKGCCRHADSKGFIWYCTRKNLKINYLGPLGRSTIHLGSCGKNQIASLRSSNLIIIHVDLRMRTLFLIKIL